MNVILLTAFVGLGLVGLATLFFLYTQSSAASGSPEQDSLLPLREDAPKPARSETRSS